MPTVSVPINDTYSTVSRPVAFSIIRKVSQICNWDFEKDELIFRGQAIQPKALAGIEAPANTANTDVKGIGDGYVSIEMNEQFEENAVIYDTVFKRNSLPIFYDDKLKVSIVPVYATLNAALAITKRFADQVSAERWYYDMKRLITQDHVADFAEADYSYTLPVQCLMVLKEIHKLRENVAPYGDKFSEYLRNGFDERATTQTNVKGEGEAKSVRLQIREHQLEINGFFDWSEPSKPEKVEGASTYDVTLTYRYYYEAPIQVVIRYPMQVHQQLLPEEYLYKVPVGQRDASMQRRGGMAVQYQDRLRNQWIPIQGRYNTVFKYPEEDEWSPPMRATAELPATTLFTALLSIDPTQPNLLVSMDALAGVGEFNEELLRWFKTYPEWMGTYYYSPVYLQVWKNNDTYDRKSWFVDSHNDLVSKDPLDLRSTYHVRLALMEDLSRLQQESFQALGGFPVLVREMLLALGCMPANIPKVNSQGNMRPADIMDAVRTLPYTAEWFRRKKNIIIPNVLIGTIVGVTSHGTKQEAGTGVQQPPAAG